MKNEGLVSFQEVCPAAPSSKLTKVWRVDSKANKTMLGSVAWFNHWRRYCFTPIAGYGLVFDANCLWDIADFCARMTAEQKEKQKAARKSEASMKLTAKAAVRKKEIQA